MNTNTKKRHFRKLFMSIKVLPFLAIILFSMLTPNCGNQIKKAFQLTSDEGNSTISYYDVPFSTWDNKIIYNYEHKDGTIDVIRINSDGSGKEVLKKRTVPSEQCKRADLSYDGRLITYFRNNDGNDSFDMYGLFLSENSNETEEIRLTEKSFTGNKMKTSPPVYNAMKGAYVIVFSVDEFLYKLTVKNKKTESLKKIDLQDSLSGKGITFHRIRLNPVYDNILMFRREKNDIDGSKTVLQVKDIDDNSPPIVFYTSKKSSHMQWTPDGSRIALHYRKNDDDGWYEYILVNGGKIIPKLNESSVKKEKIGSFKDVFYAAYSKNGKYMALVTNSLAKCDGGMIYLLNRETKQSKFIYNANFLGKYFDGQPRLGFFDNDSKLIFSTDNSFDRTMEKTSYDCRDLNNLDDDREEDAKTLKGMSSPVQIYIISDIDKEFEN